MTPKITVLLKQVADLKAQYEDARIEFLATLPSELGYESVDELIAAIRAVRKPVAMAVTKEPGSKATKKKGRRRRATITAAMRDQVASLLKAGKTAAFVASEVGISIPSVQNIKKAAGLVGKKTGAAKPAKAIKAKAAKKAVRKEKKAVAVAATAKS